MLALVNPVSFLAVGGVLFLSAEISVTPELLLSSAVILGTIALSHGRQSQRLKDITERLERLESRGACAYPACPLGYTEKEGKGE